MKKTNKSIVSPITLKVELKSLLENYFKGIVRNPQFRSRVELPKGAIKIAMKSGLIDSISVEAKIENGLLMDVNSIHALRLATESHIQGFVCGKYRSKPVIEVTIIPGKTRRIRGPARYIDLDTAVERKIIRPNSLLAKKMRKYDLRYLHIYKDIFTNKTVISGPYWGVLRAVEELIDQRKPTHLLHIFCATAAAAKVALVKRVSKVSCLDVDLRFARKNLEEFDKGKVRFIQKEAFEYFRIKNRTDRYDLVVAEPYFYQVQDVCRFLIPCLLHQTKAFLINFGPTNQELNYALVKEDLRKHFGKKITPKNPIKYAGMRIVICESPRSEL